MNGIVTPKVEAYMDGLLPQRGQVLIEIETLAAKRGAPIIGPAGYKIANHLPLIW